MRTCLRVCAALLAGPSDKGLTMRQVFEGLHKERGVESLRPQLVL
jgi:hypothetical protein